MTSYAVLGGWQLLRSPDTGTPYRTPTRSDSTSTLSFRTASPEVVSAVIEWPESALPANLDWWPAVTARLDELASLEPNWDGYGAESLSYDAARIAIGFLGAAAEWSDTLPAPFLTPIHAGIQIEWDGPDTAIEIELRTNGESRLMIERSGTVIYNDHLSAGLLNLVQELQALSPDG